MNILNWYLFGTLDICVIAAGVVVYLIRQRAKNLDGLCGVKEREGDSIEISVKFKE